MKKIISLILAATMLLAMSICLFSCDDETETSPTIYTVTVVDDNGNPVKDVVITFTPESGEFSMKVTKDEGKVTYEPAEKFTASITSVPKGYKNDAVGKTLNFDEQGNVTVVINKEVTQVTKEDYVILVVDQDGNPIEGVYVQMCADVCLAPVLTGADGKASYNVAPDSYKAQLTYLPDGYTVDDVAAKYEFVDGVATIVLTEAN